MTTEEQLLRTVQELRRDIASLASALDRDYMKRDEIRRNYTPRDVAWRRFRMLVLVVVGSLFLSYFGAITTVSACFLDQPPHASVCSAIPGYDESMEDNERIMKEFQKIQDMLRELRAERQGQ